MTQAVGDYCALASGLYWVSEIVALLEEIARGGETPNITVSGDAGIIGPHYGTVSTNNTQLAHQTLVSELLEKFDVSLERVKRTDNPARSVLG
ncbi:hypothetical protein [Halorussus halophilus]|uniref:hypothetical protein n=1 Tax=Halorussus halophilus TaxID=2650975 RepID=UPI0013014B58|nr:hypothetical protein [Halorussus halophilus]